MKINLKALQPCKSNPFSLLFNLILLGPVPTSKKIYIYIYIYSLRFLHKVKKHKTKKNSKIETWGYSLKKKIKLYSLRTNTFLMPLIRTSNLALKVFLPYCFNSQVLSLGNRVSTYTQPLQTRRLAYFSKCHKSVHFLILF